MWYSEQVQQKLDKSDSSIVDTRMSVMKPIGASWLKSLFTYMLIQLLKKIQKIYWKQVPHPLYASYAAY